MNVWLIGCGGIGNAHANAYKLMEDVNIVHAVDIDGQKATKLAGEHSASASVDLEQSLAEMANNRLPKPDYIDVCVPSYLHKNVVTRILRENIPVLCEKPMANTLEDAIEMRDMAKKTGVPLMIAQIIRFWPEYNFFKDAYDDGRYGRLLAVHFSRICSAPQWDNGWYTNPEQSGMAPFELHVHDCDFIHYMFGIPDALESYGYEDDDRFNSILKTRYYYNDKPIFVEAEADWYKAPIPFTASFRAVFDDAVMIFANNQLTVYTAAHETFVPELKTVSVGTSINLKTAGGMYYEIRYFADCIKNNVMPTIVTPDDSVRTIKLLMTELKSAQNGTKIEIGKDW